MCGRFTNTASNEELGGIFDATVIGDPLPMPSFHIHPTDAIRVVLESAKTPGRRLEGARWELVRPGQKELRRPGPPLINIRAESAQQKFAWALKHHRCVIPATGYWEWTGIPGNKRPFFFHHGDDVIAFAGVYSWWKDPARSEDDPERWTLTAALLTTNAAPHLSEIHDRNPVMLPATFWADWLDPGTAGGQELVNAAVGAGETIAEQMEFYPVRPFSGQATGPELIEPIA